MNSIQGFDLADQIIQQIPAFASAIVLLVIAIFLAAGTWIKSLSSNNGKLQERIEERNKKITDQLDVINREREAHSDTKIKLRVTESSLEHSQEKLRDVATQKSFLQDRVDELYKRLDGIEADVERRLNDAQAGFDSQINAMNQKNLEIQQQYRNEIEAKNREIEQLEADNKRYQQQIEQLIQSQNEATAKYKEIIEKQNTAIERLIKTQGELQASFNRDLDSYNARMSKIVATFEQRITIATAKLDVLESKSESETVE